MKRNRGRGTARGGARPDQVEDVLVFASKNTPAWFDTVAALTEGGPAEGAPAAIAEYVRRKQRRGASLTPLHQGAGEERTGKGAWRQLAMPRLDADDSEPSGITVLRLASPRDAPQLKALLEADTERIEYVHHPAVRYPMMAVPNRRFPYQPGLRACGFPDVWESMDTGPDPGPIAVIDQGSDSGHKELKGRITKLILPRRRPSRSEHAAAVASIIAALRGDADDVGMAGCCSALLHLYNVWTFDARFDALGYYRALRAVGKAALPVLNLSMGGPKRDPTEEWHIRYCLQRGVAVVAAMGNEGENSPTNYPAACEGVVAVGATSLDDTPLEMSSHGDHICLSAPGERIRSVNGRARYAPQSGTSFASAFVTAAVWLARRKQPSLSVDQIRKLLEVSVEPGTVPNGGHSRHIGHGRLHMPTLAAELAKMFPDARPA